MEVYGSAWKCMEVHGSAWKCMEVGLLEEALLRLAAQVESSRVEERSSNSKKRCETDDTTSRT
jgi:hypothetical protein